MRRRLGVLVLSLLQGCSGLLPKPAPAPARYTLDDGAASPAAPQVQAGAMVLQVALPRAVAGVDGPRMLYGGRAQPLQAYALAEWDEPPARLLGPLMVRALQGSGAFVAVLGPGSHAAARLRLETELLRLQQVFGSPRSHLRLTLRAVLLDARTRQVLGVQEFDLRVDAHSEDAAGGVAAARRAVGQLLPLLVAFCVESAASHGSTRLQPTR
jgi:cholesterol transport system auxiliary component